MLASIVPRGAASSHGKNPKDSHNLMITTAPHKPKCDKHAGPNAPLDKHVKRPVPHENRHLCGLIRPKVGNTTVDRAMVVT